VTAGIGIVGFLLGVIILLMGLRLMSGALISAAGTRLKAILARLVRTPLQGAIIGAASTAAVQSSSTIAATVVGLVNSRVLGMEQAFAVILGANVGTTITAQIISFDLSQFAPLIMVVGLIFVFKLHRRAVGEALFGFGALVFGLSLINRALVPWLDSPIVTYALTRLASGRLSADRRDSGSIRNETRICGLNSINISVYPDPFCFKHNT
jgi:phosphate:Na+ symporter